MMDEETTNLNMLGDVELVRLGHHYAAQEAHFKKQAAAVRQVLRERHTPGEYEFGQHKVVVKKPALVFQPAKVEELLTPDEAAAVSKLVPQKDLFTTAYGTNMLSEVCTTRAAAVEFKFS